MASTVASSIRPLAIDDRDRDIDWRAGLMALLLPSGSSAIAPAGGLLPGRSNVSGLGNADPTSTGTASAPKTTVQPYRVVIPSTTNYGWIGVNPAAVQVDHATPHATNPRIDLISARINSGSLWTEATTGVAAASPVPPAAPADSEVLWEARITSAGVITYTLRARWTAAAGGIRPSLGSESVAGTYTGELRYDPVTGQLDMWLSTAWVPIASPAQWKQYTPVLRYRGGAGGVVGLGSGGSSIGRYIKLGATLVFRLVFRWGSAPWNGGTGEIYTTLPAGMVASTVEDSWVPCHLWTTSTGFMDWDGQALIFPTENQLRPMFPIDNSDNRLGMYVIAGAVSDDNSGVPKVPANAGYFPEGGKLIIQGSIEVQS